MLTSLNTHECKGNPDAFCFICGEYKTKKNEKGFTSNMQNIYKSCFGINVTHQESNWVPHKICSACYNMLRRWEKNKKNII